MKSAEIRPEIRTPRLYPGDKLTRAKIREAVERLKGPVGDRIRREAGMMEPAI